MADEPRFQVEIRRLRLEEVKLLDVNARYMKHSTFELLVDNLRRDGQLTSAPLAWWNGDQYEVLSGNHRVAAGLKAGIEDANFLTIDQPLSESERISIQLSHNAIEGQDDPAILRELYDAIESVDLRAYAALDDETLDLLQDVKPITISEAGLQFLNLAMVFLPDEIAEAERAMDEAREVIRANDVTWLNSWSLYDEFLDSLDTAQGALGVRNTAVALMAIIRVFRSHLDDLREPMSHLDDPEWVPLSVALGGDRIPHRLAKQIADKARAAVEAGQIEAEWQILQNLL